MKIQKLKIVVLTAITISLFACEKEKLTEIASENANQNSYSEAAIINYLVDNGYDRDSIKVGKNYVNYGYDGCWNKKRLIEEMSNPSDVDSSYNNPIEINENSPHARTSQYGPKRTNPNSAVKYAGISDIKIVLRDPILARNELVAGINQAIAIFNNIPNCKIRMYLVKNVTQADIIVSLSNDPIYPWDAGENNMNVLAKGAFPSNGIVGSNIWFNSLKVGASAAEIKRLTLHEMCHNLGIHHDYGKDNDRDPFPNTRTTKDPTSIMGNAPTLNKFDKLALIMLYPDNLFQPKFPPYGALTKLAPGKVRILVENEGRTNYDYFPYYWVRIYVYNASGTTLLSTRDICKSDSDGITTIDVAGLLPNANYRFKAQGLNFRKDKISPPSAISPLIAL